MTGPDDAAPLPPKRRAPWSFKSLVEDVSGRPLADFQDPPPRPAAAPASSPLPRSTPHAGAPTGAVVPPAARTGPTDPSVVAIPAAIAEPAEPVPLDPVARIYPPLSGSTARALHGADSEHHAATLASVPPPSEAPSPGRPTYGPGPSRRPERIYLHYLLLHLDRLNDAGLRYLRTAVDEELAHRGRVAAIATAIAPVTPPTELPALASPEPPAPISETPPSP